MISPQQSPRANTVESTATSAPTATSWVALDAMVRSLSHRSLDNSIRLDKTAGELQELQTEMIDIKNSHEKLQVIRGDLQKCREDLKLAHAQLKQRLRHIEVEQGTTDLPMSTSSSPVGTVAIVEDEGAGAKRCDCHAVARLLQVAQSATAEHECNYPQPADIYRKVADMWFPATYDLTDDITVGTEMKKQEVLAQYNEFRRSLNLTPLTTHSKEWKSMREQIFGDDSSVIVVKRDLSHWRKALQQMIAKIDAAVNV